jgi:hypothetical protein
MSNFRLHQAPFPGVHEPAAAQLDLSLGKEAA